MFIKTSKTLRKFSTAELAAKHKTQHYPNSMHPKFYENEFEATSIEEIHFVRSPFYELAKTTMLEQGESTHKLLNTISTKLSMQYPTANYLKSPIATAENVAFTRYADKAAFRQFESTFQFPRGEPYKRHSAAELYRVPKTDDHWANVARSKAFLADKFLPPFSLPLDTNLRALFSDDQSNKTERLLEIIPNLNHDQLVHLALYLAFEAKINDQQVWSCLEDAALATLHLLDVTQMCQLEWASTQLKPKRVSPRLNTLLIQTVLEKADTLSPEDLMDVMQGFRNKENKTLYQKIQKLLLDKKSTYKLKKEKLINFMFMFASSRPRTFGVYKRYAKDDLDEILAHYEVELMEAAEQADAEQITRLAQTLYILKSDAFENIWWRVENRVNELADKTKLDEYQLTNILRAFSRAQNNHMVAQDKTFVHLEPQVMKLIPTMSARNLSHVMYAYGVRAAGNPDLHAAFENRMEEIAGTLDYAGLFNLVYYMLFRENANEKIWHHIVATTNKQTTVMPLIYYKPFKASMHFLTHHFPQWDGDRTHDGTFLSDYQDKFFYAEKYFNVVKLDDLYDSDAKYQDFRAFLTGHCNVYPVPFVTMHNLFTLHYVWMEQKIGIQFHLDKLCQPNKKASEMQKLPTKVLKLQGWEILDLTESEFKDWTYEQRIAQIKGWLKEAKVRQIKKGVMPPTPPIYV